MRLHRLVMTGVGPFKDRQEVDFDSLAASGLFLIEGPTGSGKTTIIDAIVYALFGVVSAGGDDVTRMRIRSHYCSDADPTGVELTFSVDGRQHHIARVPADARDPREPVRAARKTARQVLTETFTNGREPLVLTRAGDIHQHVTALLGMSSDQFRQLVVLPQGQFAELLRQTPNDRLKSLAPLLEDPFIAAVQDDLRAQGEVAQAERVEAERSVDRAAQQLVGKLDGHRQEEDVDFTDTAMPDAEREAAVRVILDRLTTQVASAKAEREAHLAEVGRLGRAADQAAQVLQVLTEAASARTAVDAARTALPASDADITEDAIDARLGQLHQRVGSLEADAAWESAAPRRARQRQDLIDRLATCTDTIARLRSEQAALPARRADLDTRQGAATALAATLPAAQAEESRQQVLLKSARDLAALRTSLVTLGSEQEKAERALAEAQQHEEAAFDAWRELVQEQRAVTAADLAQHLVDGEPCPVCGSADHPHPAQTRSPGVTDADVTAALTAAHEARTFTGAARIAATAAGTALTQAAARADALATSLGDADEQDLDAALSAAAQARAEAEAARDALPSLAAERTELTSLERTLDGDIAAALTESAVLTTQVQTHDEQEKVRQAQITDAIDGAASATELIATTRVRLSALDVLAGAWKQLALALAKLPAGDLPSLEQAQESDKLAQEALADAQARLRAVEEEVTRLSSTLSGATPLAAALTRAMGDRRTVRERTAAAIEVATLVAAGNSRRLQLRSYALQRRFASVLAAASIHLSRMSMGKFTFEANDETARAGHSGLGILLYDAWTGSPQDPKSLSGGETFYAALALALGLADVIRGEAGGSALETLFVDEGFGSLDQDTLYQVLEQLDLLRSGHRAVGVVSHVTEMKESIQDRIEVRRQADSTSTIVVG